MKARIALVVALVLVCLTAGVGYVGFARDRVAGEIERRNEVAESYVEAWETAQAAEGDTDPVDADLPFRAGDLVVVNKVPGPEYGRLTLWRGGERAYLDLECDRAHATRERLVCLRPTGGLGGGSRSVIETYRVSSDGFELLAMSEMGVASRARVSPDGSHAAATVFVQGHSYLDAGGFATATEIIEQTTNGVRFHSLEGDFTVDNGDPAMVDQNYQVIDANWWGVTFAPDPDEFYVTFGAGQRTEVLRGSVSQHRLQPFLDDAACPSLSPDGQTMVVKRLDGGGTRPEMAAIDVATGTATPVAEDRFVEDHPEWLDNDTILYALPHEGADDGPQPAMDIWTLDLHSGAEPRIFLPYASSPAVVR